MFTGGLAEQQQGVVCIRRVSAEMLSTLLDFIYTGQSLLTGQTGYWARRLANAGQWCWTLYFA